MSKRLKYFVLCSVCILSVVRPFSTRSGHHGNFENKEILSRFAQLLKTKSYSSVRVLGQKLHSSDPVKWSPERGKMFVKFEYADIV